MRFYINLDSGKIQTSPQFGQAIGIEQGTVSARLFSSVPLEVAFCRAGSIVRVDDAGLDFILKRNEGDQRYDAPQLNASIVFTEFSEVTSEATDWYWRGFLDLTAPVFQKLLGVDLASAKEQVSVLCVADEDYSLLGTFFDLYHTTAAFKRIWMNLNGTQDPPASGGSSAMYSVVIANGASAATVATAIAAAFASNSDIDWEADVVGDTVTFTAKAFGVRGWHSPATTGFTLTLITCGSQSGVIADVASVTLLSQFAFEYSAAPQTTEIFGLAVQNTLVRPTLASPGAPGGRVRSAEVAIGEDVSTVTVVFASPMPTSAWLLEVAQVVNTTDGSPLTLFVGTMTSKSTLGFTVQLNGNTDSENYVFSYSARY